MIDLTPPAHECTRGTLTFSGGQPVYLCAVCRSTLGRHPRQVRSSLNRLRREPLLNMTASTPEQRPIGVYATNTRRSSKIPVDLPTNTPVTVFRGQVPVSPGDTLDITAEARVTNNTTYNIGVGSRLIAEGATARPVQIGSPTGDNVDRQRHHMPITLTRLYVVPHDFPDPFIVISLRVDAHSTAWKAGDTLVVDPYGTLIVRRWSVID